MTEQNVPKNVFEIILELRTKAGLSQNALAHEAGMDPTNLSRIERSRQGTPRPNTILKLHHALSHHLPPEESDKLLDLIPLGLKATTVIPDTTREALLPEVLQIKHDLLKSLVRIVAVEESLKNSRRSI